MLGNSHGYDVEGLCNLTQVVEQNAVLFKGHRTYGAYITTERSMISYRFLLPYGYGK